MPRPSSKERREKGITACNNGSPLQPLHPQRLAPQALTAPHAVGARVAGDATGERRVEPPCAPHRATPFAQAGQHPQAFGAGDPTLIPGAPPVTGTMKTSTLPSYEAL